MHWIPHPLTLSGLTAELISLEKAHARDLENIARDKRIWEHYVYDASTPAGFESAFSFSWAERERGTQFPFVIYHKPSGRIVGSTRYMDIQPRHKKLEIGSTWIDPAFWGTDVNVECKLLMLSYCFETLGTVRVHLKTDENNVRSRKAIEKIGGQFEGIVRHDMIRDNGTYRNSASYSIILADWQQVKQHLRHLLETRRETIRSPETG